MRDKFDKYHIFCIEFFKDSGARTIKVLWDKADRQQVVMEQRSRVSLEEPEDDFWEYNLYLDEFGDQRKKRKDNNGTGHKVAAICDFRHSRSDNPRQRGQ